MNIDNKNARIMIKFGLNVERNVDRDLYKFCNVINYDNIKKKCQISLTEFI